MSHVSVLLPSYAYVLTYACVLTDRCVCVLTMRMLSKYCVLTYAYVLTDLCVCVPDLCVCADRPMRMCT